MARYIDADKLLESLQEELDYYPLLYTREQNEWFDKGLKRALRIVKTFPAADVVPKSEVDKTIAEWAHLHADVLNKLENVRAEVAREIFEEIEEHIEVSSLCSLDIEEVKGILAELKKKYAGGE